LTNFQNFTDTLSAQQICSKAIMKDPASPWSCLYATLWLLVFKSWRYCLTR